MCHTLRDHVENCDIHHNTLWYVARRKSSKSKYHGAANECISEQEKFDWTEITFAPRKYGGCVAT